MGDILPFRKPDRRAKARGHTLCRNGLHKWVVDKQRQFDASQGRLVTLYRCSRCDATRIRSH